MQWKARKGKSFDERYPNEKPWKWWFAWYPVTESGTTYWLCWIPRRYVRNGRYLVSYVVEYMDPKFSIGGNILGKEGYKHGPNKKLIS